MKVAKISNPCHVNSSFRYKFRRIERFSVGIPFYELKIPSSYIRTRGISRVTTLIRKLLAQLTSMSVRQHSSAFNVHQSVTAYLLNQSVQCTARGGTSHLCFPRTSHQPVTFCAFHKAVLIPVFAFRCFNCIYYRRVRSLLSTANRCFLSRICLMNALLQAFILK